MNESELKSALTKLISESSLSPEDKDLWNKSLENSPFEIMLAVHSFLIDYGGKLQEATNFLKRKISAINSKD